MIDTLIRIAKGYDHMNDLKVLVMIDNHERILIEDVEDNNMHQIEVDLNYVNYYTYFQQIMMDMNDYLHLIHHRCIQFADADCFGY